MNRVNNTLFLFTIIFLEGYIVLSAELLSIRLSIPFVGSGSDTVSIIIAAVLMPLAVGYYAGGRFKNTYAKGKSRTIRKKLLTNIIIASIILLPGLSYFVLIFFFDALDKIGLEHNIIKISLYSLIFLVTPVYLLGQTVPLISNYFSKDKLSKITGKMLFFSTIGSFFGSLLTTLFLMDAIGVNNTVTLLFCLLFILILMLSKDKASHLSISMACILGFACILNSSSVSEMLNIVKNNKYSTMMIMELKDDIGTPHLIINNNDSSKYAPDGTKHDYVELAERLTIEALPKDAPPKDILIIGAGGFTFGHNDRKNNFIYIDIDKDLKEISEKYLLKEKIQENKTFYPLPARAYLAGTNKKFDVILLDAYLGGLSIPEHLVTQEFFQEVKAHLKDKGILVANFITSPNFKNRFSKNIDNTLRSVFPYISRQDAHGDNNIWTTSYSQNSNYIYIYKFHKGQEDGLIYHDPIETEK